MIAFRRPSPTRARAALTGSVACALLAAAAPAHAQSTIRYPGQRPHYVFEAEPHLALAPFDPPQAGRADGFGLGFRGSFQVAPDGFIRSINDSVALGVGLDYLHYSGNDLARGNCDEFVPGPNGVLICTRVSPGGSANYFFVPAVMQWNFWLARRWSVFGEPGFALFLRDGNHLGFSPVIFYAGGRFHINDRVTLSMRLGYPSFSIGVSFLN